MGKLKLPYNITTKADFESVLNTLNPFSRVFGTGTTLYVPQFLINLFKTNKHSVGQAAKSAHIFAKTVGGASAAAAILAAIRLGAHAADMDRINMAGHTAGLKLLKQYDAPTAALLQDQKKPLKLFRKEVVDKVASVQKQALAYTALNAVLPPTALFLAALATYNAVDRVADKMELRKLNKDIATQLKLINNIGAQNIQLARGVKPANKPISKNANFNFSSSAAFLALLAAVGAGTLGFNIQRGYDLNTVDYKALKKGILLYNKARVALQPLAASPIDAKMLSKLDLALTKKKNKLPLVDLTAVYKPVDII